MAAPIASTAAPVFLGLKLYEVLTLIGIILGPIVAVLVASGRERTLRERDQQVRILGTIMTNRAAPGGADWDSAFAVVPLHFNKSKAVTDQWRVVLAHLNTVATPGNEAYHDTEQRNKVARLIFRMAQVLRIDVTEAEIISEAYISQGSVNRHSAYRVVPNALIAIAETLKEQFAFIKGLKSPSE